MPDDARPWLLGCARRVLANQRRGARRRQALLDRLTQSAAATNALPTFSDGVLAQALAKLSEPDRELLMLIAWEGLDPAQAAVVLGCSRGALGVRLHRARRRLAGAIARLEREEAAASREVEVLG
jgi:RNA polymerase sigma-70 factor (ECF subfamily)